MCLFLVRSDCEHAYHSRRKVLNIGCGGGGGGGGQGSEYWWGTRGPNFSGVVGWSEGVE